MDISFHGANCIRINTKKASITIDDNLKKLGGSNVAKKDDIVLYTSESLVGDPKEPKTIIAMPGEYEISSTAIIGIPARAHMDEEGKKTATIYKIVAGELRLLVVGHIHPDLPEETLEKIGTTDILIVPVGGNGYTLDALGALKIIKKVEPKIIIPTHFGDKDLKFEVPQADLADALKGLSMEASETIDKLKLKSTDIPENTKLIVLEKK
ncbi:MAG: MBL fold metallo-hydrolase [bacterium]|nr:MBL fold metallo-hydrolase [bacterium]